MSDEREIPYAWCEEERDQQHLRDRGIVEKRKMETGEIADFHLPKSVKGALCAKTLTKAFPEIRKRKKFRERTGVQKVHNIK